MLSKFSQQGKGKRMGVGLWSFGFRVWGLGMGTTWSVPHYIYCQHSVFCYNCSMTLTELRKLKPQIQALAAQYKIEPDSIRVFGSVARGDATADSDVDFLVHPMEGCSAFSLGGFYMDMRALIGLEADIVSDRGLHPKIAPFILEDATRL